MDAYGVWEMRLIYALRPRGVMLMCKGAMIRHEMLMCSFVHANAWLQLQYDSRSFQDFFCQISMVWTSRLSSRVLGLCGMRGARLGYKSS